MTGMVDTQETVRQSVSKDEVEGAFRVPAPGSSKFVVHIGQPGIRITFGETGPEMNFPVFHSAVTLHPMGAIELYKLLEEMLRDIENQIIKVRVKQSEG